MIKMNVNAAASPSENEYLKDKEPPPQWALNISMVRGAIINHQRGKANQPVMRLSQ